MKILLMMIRTNLFFFLNYIQNYLEKQSFGNYVILFDANIYLYFSHFYVFGDSYLFKKY